ncbi:transaldolase [Alicyclobacillus hesperidum URH17-3-68]|nr:transaldolase [Alicyclobacillus hesperidum URH17-3-68]
MPLAVTANASLVAKRDRDGTAETKADVLDEMMIVDVDVAIGCDIEIERAVRGKKV